jgi:hypothetical protein
VLKDLRLELKEAQERRMRVKEAKRRRHQSASRRATATGSVDLEKALVLGLVDVCPRCGESLEDFESEDACREHLLLCTSEEKHAAYARRKESAARQDESRRKKLESQETAEAQAAFTFLGAHDSQLWLLNDEQIRHRAVERGLDDTGSKDEVIQRLVNRDKNDNDELSSGIAVARRKRKAQCEDSDSAVVIKRKIRSIPADSVPSNLYGMSVSQLKSFCASNGLLSPLAPKATKDEIIATIEEAVYE